MLVLTCANQKGGVGKTTTAVHLAVALDRAGRRVRLVDLDAQRNAVLSLCEEDVDPETTGGGAWLRWPACREVEVWSPAGDRAEDLVHAFDSEDELEFVVLDCPPSLDARTQAALREADHVLVPLQCEFLAMEGLAQILGRIAATPAKAGKAEGDTKHDRKVHVLPVMLESSSAMHQDILADVWRHLPEDCCHTWIPRDAGFAEASSFGRSLFSQNIKSIGARAYAKLAREVQDGWT